MSSLAPRLPFLRLPSSSFLTPAAGPSTFRTFTSAAPRLRAIAVDDLPDQGSKVTLPLRAPEASTEGNFISCVLLCFSVHDGGAEEERQAPL